MKRVKSLVTPYITDKFRVLFSAITLLCGTMIVTGVFLPWFHVSMTVLSFTLSPSGSGWDLALHNSLLLKAFIYISGQTFPQPYVMLGSGILLIVCAVCIFMIPLLKKERLKIAGIVQSITAAIAASVSFSMAMWFLAFVIELRGYREDLSINSLNYGFGFYISMAFSSIALITGIAAVVKGLRQLRCDNKNDGPVVSGGFV